MMPLIAQVRRTAAIDFSTIESLRDGRRIEIRALRPTDLPRLVAQRLSQKPTNRQGDDTKACEIRTAYQVPLCTARDDAKAISLREAMSAPTGLRR